MKEVNISEVGEGDVTAADLANADGIVLLPKGTQLSASIITRLKKMDVESIAIESGQEERAAAMEVQLKLLEERFMDCGEDPYFIELKTIAMDHMRV